MADLDRASGSYPGMRKSTRKRKLILLICAVAGLTALGGAAYWWTNKKEDTAPASSQSQAKDEDAEASAPKCPVGENERAGKGVFCSEEIGIKLNVDDLFQRKLAKGKNYDLQKYDFEKQELVVAGQSELVYQATHNDPRRSDTANVYTLLIAKTPLMSRRGPCSSTCQFDSDTKALYEDNTQPGASEPSLGKEIESTTVDGAKLFKAVIGDSGDYSVTYMGVLGDKVIEITLRANAHVGESKETYKVDQEKLFIEFDKLVQTLKVLK